MKTSKKRVFSGVGIALISLAMVFSALSCDNGGGDKEKEPYTPFPQFLEYSQWHYSSTGKVEDKGYPIIYFSGSGTIKIYYKNDYENDETHLEKIFELKKVVYAEGADMYSFLYDDDVTKNNVAVREKKVTMVNFECLEVKYRNGPWVYPWDGSELTTTWTKQ